MNRNEAARLVRREVESVIAAEGFKPPVPHIVLEVVRRLGTLKPWDGLPEGKRAVATGVRELVEEALSSTPKRRGAPAEVAEMPTKRPHGAWVPQEACQDLIGVPPLLAAKTLKAAKHRHLSSPHRKAG